MYRLWLLAVLCGAAQAETYTLTLKEAVERATAQNPEIVMARMDQIKADQAIRVAKDPFSTHVAGGSGLAYSYGNPQTVDGSAPSIFQARASQELFNKPQSYTVQQAKENAKGAGLATGEKRDQIAYRVSTMYVDLDRTSRLEDSLSKQVDSLQKVFDTVDARVQLGRELPVAKKEAYVSLLKAQQRLEILRADKDYAARSLAATLGYGPQDSVKPAPTERAPLAIPSTEEAAVQAALAASKELRRLESSYIAKGLEIKGDKAQRLPKVDLIAQYAVLSPINNYSQYYLKFQRNEVEIGASIQVPLVLGPGVKAQITQADADRQRIRAQAEVERNRIVLDIHRGFQELTKANMSSQVAKADLDLAREQLSVVLAQMNEGRATLRQVEDARFAENEKWIAFYDAQFGDEKARLAVLNQTGQLLAALE
jgi:outer membrane protein TolC